MNAFAHLEAPLREVPLFPVEPRDSGAASEAQRQARFRARLRIVAPEVMSWGVPNAGKRGLTAQRRAKTEGLTAGVFDEHYVWGNQIVCLEWKDSAGRLSDNQIRWGNAMARRGFRVACVRTPGFAEALFREWGAPFIDRENSL